MAPYYLIIKLLTTRDGSYDYEAYDTPDEGRSWFPTGHIVHDQKDGTLVWLHWADPSQMLTRARNNISVMHLRAIARSPDAWYEMMEEVNWNEAA